MAPRIARLFFFLLLGGLAFGLAGWSGPVGLGANPRTTWAGPAQAGEQRVVFVSGELLPEDLTTFTVTVAAGAPNAQVLFDSAAATTYLRAFLSAYHPDQVVPVGPFSYGIDDLEKRLQVRPRPAVVWNRGLPRELWRALFPQAEQVVVCPAEPRPLFLQAAYLAGVLRAPLYVVHGRPAEHDELHQWLGDWKTKQVYAVGNVGDVCKHLTGLHVVHLADETATAAAGLREQLKQGPVTNLVVANPTDYQQDSVPLSALAPWIAVQRHAALLLTNVDGDNVEEVVHEAVRTRPLRHADSVILVGNLTSIPMKRRPNPIAADKDPEIEMEPLTPRGDEPFSFAVGRLFSDDLSGVVLQLAQQRLLLQTSGPRKALVASNSGGSLALLETFSRTTAKELKNAGYETTARFGKEVTGDELRRLMPEHDIFLWEGHHNTLIKDYAMPDWDEPLPPTLVFLQSCLALKETKAQPLLCRGAVGVLGTSTRTYSASGGALSLAFFDALLYDHQSVGASLRQAKNFLLAYRLLKEKRLGADAQRAGANQRAAWAFTLWGDPTLQMPRPEVPEQALEPIRHEVHGNTIVVKLPNRAYDRIFSANKYQVLVTPNSHLAGLLRKDKEEDGQPLVPFVFVEVHLPKAPAGAVPQLHSKLPASHYVFCWDQHRRCGYLLVTPRARDEDELRFHVEWNVAETTKVGP